MPSPLALPFALANLLLIVGALVASRRELGALLPRSRDRRRALFLVLLVAFSVRVLNPYRPVHFEDEWFYIDQSHALVRHRLNVFCTLGDMDDCGRFGVFYPIGYPVVLSLTSSLLGFTDVAARAVGIGGGIATVLVTYLLARLLTRDERTALVASLVLALLPMHIRYAMTTSSEMVSVLTEALAILGAVLHVRTGRPANAWLAATSLAFHLTVRRENPLALIPVLAVYGWGGKVRRSPFPWIVALVLVMPHISGYNELNMSATFQLITTQAEDGGLPLHPKHIPRNLWYVRYWLDGYFVPFLFTGLALMGAAAIQRLPPPYFRLVASWWVVRMGVYLLNHFLSFTPRFMLSLSVPFALAAGAGAHAFSPWTSFVIGAVLLSGAAHLPFAYSERFGLELAEGVRSAMVTTHLIIPLALLLWVAWRSRARDPRPQVVVAVACLFLVPLLYPLVDATDGVHRAQREAFALEERTIDGWRHLVGPDCHVIVVEPVRPRYLWRRPTVVANFNILSTEVVRDILKTDLDPLLRDGECVYFYDPMPNGRTRALIHEEYVLELLDRIDVGKVAPDATTLLEEIALYRMTGRRPSP